MVLRDVSNELPASCRRSRISLRDYLLVPLLFFLSIIIVWSDAAARFDSNDFAQVDEKRIDISELAPGEQVTVVWHGTPIVIHRRTNEQIAYMKNLGLSPFLAPRDEFLDSFLEGRAESLGNQYANLLLLDQPTLSQKPLRSIIEGVGVYIESSPAMGCQIVPIKPGSQHAAPGFEYGFFDLCRDLKFGLDGRVYKDQDKKHRKIVWNLPIPPHQYDGKNTLVIGLGTPPRTVGTRDFQPFVFYLIKSPVERMVTAARYGAYKTVQATLKSGEVDVNSANENGISALSMAAMKDQEAIVDLLLENGASPDVVFSHSNEALLCGAIYLKNLSIFRKLAMRSRNLQPRCSLGPLLIATMRKRGDQEWVDQQINILLKAGADPNVSADGITAIKVAESLHMESTANLLRTALSEGK